MTGKKTDESNRSTPETRWELAGRERVGDGELRPTASSRLGCEPLPGLMDHIGAHVGGELAEERWR